MILIMAADEPAALPSGVHKKKLPVSRDFIILKMFFSE